MYRIRYAFDSSISSHIAEELIFSSKKKTFKELIYRLAQLPGIKAT